MGGLEPLNQMCKHVSRIREKLNGLLSLSVCSLSFQTAFFLFLFCSFCLLHKSNLLCQVVLLLCSTRWEILLVLSSHIPADTLTTTQAQTSLACTCRQCGEEIRLHQMHNTVLISMPTNLTQSKKVTLCRNQKGASLFQNCMPGSLQADQLSEWDSLKRNVFHLWLTTSCSRQNWKTILISDQCNGWDTSVRKHLFFSRLLSFEKSSLAFSPAWQKYTHYKHRCQRESNFVSSVPCLPNSICSPCMFPWLTETWLARQQFRSLGLVGGFHSLPVAQCDDGQDGGFGSCFWCVCVVPCWVRVTPTCINELMRRLKLAFKSPLVFWPWCPPLYPQTFLLSNPLFTDTVNITGAGRCSVIYIASRRRAASLSCSELLMMKWGRMCISVLSDVTGAEELCTRYRSVLMPDTESTLEGWNVEQVTS